MNSVFESYQDLVDVFLVSVPRALQANIHSRRFHSSRGQTDQQTYRIENMTAFAGHG